VLFTEKTGLGKAILETAPVSVEGATGPVEGMVQLVVTDPMLRLLSAVPIQVVVEVRPEPTPIPDEEETAEEGG
jgi:hypothetical protein